MNEYKFDEKEEYNKIHKNPYSYICNDWIETLLPKVGKKSFEIASLMPCSLILPEICLGSKYIKPIINMLEVSGSGTGKSSKAEKFEKITYFPLKVRDITDNELQNRAVNMEMLSLIIEDFSQFSEDYERIKVLEGVIGEESSVSKTNMRVDLFGETHALAYLFGTPQDLERYASQIEGGLLSRCILNVICLTPDEHNEIGRYVNSKVGEEDYAEKMNIREQTVIKYYKELKTIQSGTHEKISPVVKYHIEKKFRDQVFEFWSKQSKKLIADLGEKSYIRDLNSYYKLLVSSAFLNIFNRKVEKIEIGRDQETGKIINGSILFPNEEDHKLAINLMKQNMKSKWALDKAMWYKKNVKTFDMFKKILNESTSEVRNILINISPYARMIIQNGDKKN